MELISEFSRYEVDRFKTGIGEGFIFHISWITKILSKGTAKKPIEKITQNYSKYFINPKKARLEEGRQKQRDIETTQSKRQTESRESLRDTLTD